MKLLFATQNQHKYHEIKKLMPDNVELINLAHLGFMDELPETQHTLEGNALQKARFVYEQHHINCFADDTGLEINALDGAPGVLSARYAGDDKDPVQNMKKVLEEMKEKDDRSARFRTVIATIIDEKEYIFEGIVGGSILTEQRGENGFGYDPIFLPDGYNSSFAEMDLNEKNQISHRGEAIKKLVKFLKSLPQ
ncbi:MAG: non-canonical purine NTP diphosphatase [Bacteroidota bacterium]